MRNQGANGGTTKSLGKKVPLKGETKPIPSPTPAKEHQAPTKLHR